MPPLGVRLQAPRSTLAILVLTLRILLLALASINLCALTAAFQLYQSYSPYSTSRNLLYSFQDTPQLAINTFLFLAGIYSFLGNTQWSRRVRIIAGLILLGCNVILVSLQFNNIALNGGCEHGRIYNTPMAEDNTDAGPNGSGDAGAQIPPASDIMSSLKRRCIIQMVIGIVGVCWSALLAVELVLTNLHRKRDLDHKVRICRVAYQERLRQQQLSSSAVHLYHPDLSLQGTGRSRDSLELEALPAYERRPTGPRPQIVDLANMGRLSTRPTGGRPRPETIQSPPPSYQAA
ncbi:hypothetical protein BC939DRAFT_452898 [Gamsiella multidivaricata]|uniref:uncharacterized protein n=1 Tax=Gamsiella multidivaricata TaxID=101098 RepID=UPI00221EBB88|nr:uncharacterized protein BC939DRAFT_452898 [Gamsiella multidivaricata]KAG0352293.1 hypothetical protein BGZ54_002867 [Gamsiella multidivaricata]KAI7822884.1 hypothetical protein BC939DRAFT_452898 [Gamsiella multidivaricata]